MKIIVAYATTEGQTRKIAEWIGDWVRRRGDDVCVLDVALADEDTRIAGFDLYILAGSLHMEKHQSSLERFVKRHLLTLQRAPSAFLSVSATASRKDEESQAAAQRCIDDFIKRTGWQPSICEPVGGAIKYTKYNFLTRYVMKRISAKNGGPTDTSRDHELTDWKTLGEFLNTLFESYCPAQDPAPREVATTNS